MHAKLTEDMIVHTSQVILAATFAATVYINTTHLSMKLNGNEQLLYASDASVTTKISTTDNQPMINFTNYYIDDIEILDQEIPTMITSENNDKNLTDNEIEMDSLVYQKITDDLIPMEPIIDTDEPAKTSYEDVNDPDSPLMGIDKIPDDMISEKKDISDDTDQYPDITYEGYYMNVKGKEMYVNPVLNNNWNKNGHVTSFSGIYHGPGGLETYYNLPMGGVISIMRGMGFDEENWPYWVREDGCKMLGDYVMVACNLQLRPRGTLIETSMGMGIVCDTDDTFQDTGNEFLSNKLYQTDIAVNW